MTPHRYDDVLSRIRERQPVCGSSLVVAIDGPSGSGKTTIADELGRVSGGTVLHLDDIYPGWHGLAATPPMVAGALSALEVGEVGTVDRWDWVRNRPGPALLVPPTDLLILDGVGSGAAVLRPHLSFLIWVEAPMDVRKKRALRRDGGTYAPFWDIWAEQEARHFVDEGTRRHADLELHTDA